MKLREGYDEVVLSTLILMGFTPLHTRFYLLHRGGHRPLENIIDRTRAHAGHLVYIWVKPCGVYGEQNYYAYSYVKLLEDGMVVGVVRAQQPYYKTVEAGADWVKRLSKLEAAYALP